jgi:hypothetical protein
MSNEMITSLPTVTNASLTDIIYAVQGYTSPTSIGTSVQETLGQVLSLIQSNVIAHFAGNPNGNVAGTQYQSLCWDSADNFLWICTTSGTASTAVWKPIIGALTNGQLAIGSTGNAPVQASLTAGPGISILPGAGSIQISGTASGIGWTDVTGASQAMTADNGYTANRSSLVTFTLPVTAAYGTGLAVIGKGSGGWVIGQNAGQNIQIGSSSTTVGGLGSVASTNQFDAINMVCTTANTTWTVMSGPQGNLSIF